MCWSEDKRTKYQRNSKLLLLFGSFLILCSFVKRWSVKSRKIYRMELSLVLYHINNLLYMDEWFGLVGAENFKLKPEDDHRHRHHPRRPRDDCESNE